ncbi:MAG: hypothetical protein JST93_04240 [Acidobacteria bacterium]|nr:hypothetical protein [Acidobacteriota bacterium]
MDVVTLTILVIASLGGKLALAQPPVLDARPLLHAAKLEPADSLYSALTEMSLAIVVGSNLASGTASAEHTPLPFDLLGTTVFFNGTPAPLVSVSPEKIVLQVPRGPFLSSPPDWSVRMTVSHAGGSASAAVFIGGSRFGIFMNENQTCGTGEVYNLKNGSLELNTPRNAAEPGGLVVVYGTGLGPVSYPAVAPGDAAPSDPPSRFLSALEAPRLGDPELNISLGDLPWVGRVPGLVGVDQVNIRVSPRAPEGCDLPFWLPRGDRTSQAVPISIRRGGGPCPPSLPAPTGLLRWEKTIATGSLAFPPEQDEFVLDFSRTPIPVPALPIPPNAQHLVSVPHFTTRCPVMDNYAKHLELGGIQLLTPSGAAIEPEFNPVGPTEYRSKLPLGSIQPGNSTVRGGASVEIGPFETSLSIPPPIRVKTDLRPGTVFVLPFAARGFGNIVKKIEWEGGDPDSAVMVRVRTGANDPSRPSSYTFRGFFAEARRGEVEIFFGPSTQGLEIEVWNYRETRLGTSVVVDGIPEPVTHGWRYRYVFAGLEARFQ